jgi:hypothetical protein
MVAEDAPIDPRDELRLAEEELETARQTATELRRRIGDRADAPTDSAEIAERITAAEEQEALVEMLAARRERLLQRIRAESPSGGRADTSAPAPPRR